MYSKNNICLAPTYRCNAKCPFCYAKKLKKTFPHDMEWDVFVDIVSMLRGEKINEISFLGGEPTIWPHISKAVNFLKNLKIQVNFFTNGITHSDSAPDCVLINIYNSFSGSVKKLIKSNIKKYKESGVEVGLRYNLNSDDGKAAQNDLFFIEMAEPLADYISISPAVPYRLTTNLGERIYNLVVEAKERNMNVKVSRAIPICIFTRGQFNYLRKTAFLRTECYSEKNILINPDGKTAFGCVNLSILNFDLSKISYKNICLKCKNFFKKSFAVRSFDSCEDCEHHHATRCQGGCLGLKKF